MLAYLLPHEIGWWLCRKIEWICCTLVGSRVNEQNVCVCILQWDMFMIAASALSTIRSKKNVRPFPPFGVGKCKLWVEFSMMMAICHWWCLFHIFCCCSLQSTGRKLRNPLKLYGSCTFSKCDWKSVSKSLQRLFKETQAR